MVDVILVLLLRVALSNCVCYIMHILLKGLGLNMIKCNIRVDSASLHRERLDCSCSNGSEVHSAFVWWMISEDVSRSALNPCRTRPGRRREAWKRHEVDVDGEVDPSRG